MFKKAGDAVKKFFLTSGEEIYNDEDYYDEEEDYDNYEEPYEEDPMQEHYSRGGAARRTPERPARRHSYQDKIVELGYAGSGPTPAKPTGYQPTAVQVRPVAIIAHPKEISEAAAICDYLKSGKMVIVDLTGLDSENAQRIADYLGGVVHTMEGQTTRINKGIFSVSPKEYEVMLAGEEGRSSSTSRDYGSYRAVSK